MQAFGTPSDQATGRVAPTLRSVLDGYSVRYSPYLLIVPVAIAAAGGAGAQTIIGPGTISSTQNVTGPGTTTVVANTQINVPSGDGIDAPGYNGVGGTLTIDTERTLPVTPIGPGPISITIPAGKSSRETHAATSVQEATSSRTRDGPAFRDGGSSMTDASYEKCTKQR
jgi:hypothetical protein